MALIAFDRKDHFLSYTEYGKKSGFPILIHHGLIASINDHAIFARLIELGARLICMARPGYGASTPYPLSNIGGWADIVSALVDRLEVSHFDILGMSSGAPYSYAIGYRFPDKVRNIYIFSGIPALYDDEILSYWPFELKKNASIAEMERLAYELFFANLSPDDLAKDDIKDSMMNNCFGIAQDFRLRCMVWVFKLSHINTTVTMRHSRFDDAVPYVTAELTSKMLPNCNFETMEGGVHFSKEALDDFIDETIAPHWVK